MGIIKKILFRVLVLLYLIGMFSLIVYGVYGAWHYFIRSNNSQIAAFLSGRPEPSVKVICIPPSPRPRLEELKKLVYEQLKKEAAEEAAKKISPKG